MVGWVSLDAIFLCIFSRCWVVDHGLETGSFLPSASTRAMLIFSAWLQCTLNVAEAAVFVQRLVLSAKCSMKRCLQVQIRPAMQCNQP